MPRSFIVALAVVIAVAPVAGAEPGTPPTAAAKPPTAAAKPPAAAAKPPAAAAKPPAAPDLGALPLVVTPAWLAAHLDEPDLVLLHVGDAEAYRAKHLPRARLVTLDDIARSAPHGEGLTLELLPADALRERLEGLGISSASRVIVYVAEDWVSWATRVVLTLDAAGLGAQTTLLDGGMPAWLRAGHAVTGAASPTRRGTLAPLTLRPIIVDAAKVVASLGKPGIAVVDARDAAYYAGTSAGGMPGHTHRAGHITGALSLPFDSVFDDHHVLRSPEELRAQFTRAGVKPGDTVIGYCHIGQQATAMLFAARRLGHPVLLYDGSFEDWSQHAGYPVTTVATRPAAESARSPAESR